MNIEKKLIEELVGDLIHQRDILHSAVDKALGLSNKAREEGHPDTVGPTLAAALANVEPKVFNVSEWKNDPRYIACMNRMKSKRKAA